jgi:hypothetical protein
MNQWGQLLWREDMSQHAASLQSPIPLAYNSTPRPRNRAASIAEWLAAFTVALLATLFWPVLAPFYIVFYPLCIFCAASAVGAGVLGVRDARRPGAPGRRSSWAGIFIGVIAIILMLIQLRLAIQYSDSRLH